RSGRRPRENVEDCRHRLRHAHQDDLRAGAGPEAPTTQAGSLGDGPAAFRHGCGRSRAPAIRGRAALTRDVTIAPLLPTHRTQIEAILRTTGVFSDEEIAVGLELFDAG